MRIGFPIFAIVILLLAGCGYVAPVMPPQGLIVSSIQAPIDTDVENTPVGVRSGRASSTSILGLVSFGDASTHTAASNGGIKKINHLDYEYVNILFLYQQFTTIAYGE
jgi:hypothetical protein